MFQFDLLVGSINQGFFIKNTLRFYPTSVRPPARSRPILATQVDKPRYRGSLP